MTRNMKEANTQIFGKLDAFCASKDVPVRNSGNPRWIHSENKHKHFLTNARVQHCFDITLSRKIVRLEFLAQSCYIFVGFDSINSNSDFVEVEIEPSHLTVLLFEVAVRPKVNAFDVSNIIGSDDKNSNPAYRGHDAESIRSLFPNIRMFECGHLSNSEMWKLLFPICVAECSENESWVTEELAETLASMCQLDPIQIPYQMLCKAIFDTDPVHFFLAQYRCLEALYAYNSARILAGALQLSVPWSDVATALEVHLGWHPKEETSLEALLRYSSDVDLRSICRELNRDRRYISNDRLHAVAAKCIYATRNSIVHFSPAQHRFESTMLNWTEVCKALAGMILDVYAAVF